jgi:hypothetical protein
LAWCSLVVSFTTSSVSSSTTSSSATFMDNVDSLFCSDSDRVVRLLCVPSVGLLIELLSDDTSNCHKNNNELHSMPHELV